MKETSWDDLQKGLVERPFLRYWLRDGIYSQPTEEMVKISRRLKCDTPYETLLGNCRFVSDKTIFYPGSEGWEFPQTVGDMWGYVLRGYKIPGYCRTFSLFFATLSRCQRIPTRIREIYLNLGEFKVVHFVTESWIGEWCFSDPTNGLVEENKDIKNDFIGISGIDVASSTHSYERFELSWQAHNNVRKNPISKSFYYSPGKTGLERIRKSLLVDTLYLTGNEVEILWELGYEGDLEDLSSGLTAPDSNINFLKTESKKIRKLHKNDLPAHVRNLRDMYRHRFQGHEIKTLAEVKKHSLLSLMGL